MEYPDDWSERESELWEEITGELEDRYGEYATDDSEAQRLFHNAFFSEYFPGDTESARDAFFDYMEDVYDYDYDDFDWGAWREAMGY